MKFLADHAADACLCVGACLIGVGVFAVWPTGTWFYSGAVCLVAGYLAARAEKGAA